jgi:hypothetical protein
MVSVLSLESAHVKLSSTTPHLPLATVLVSGMAITPVPTSATPVPTTAVAASAISATLKVFFIALSKLIC